MVPLEYSYKFDAFILYTSDCLAQSQVCMCAFYFLSGHHCAVRIPLGVFWLQHICFLNQPVSGTGSLVGAYVDGMTCPEGI